MVFPVFKNSSHHVGTGLKEIQHVIGFNTTLCTERGLFFRYIGSVS